MINHDAETGPHAIAQSERLPGLSTHALLAMDLPESSWLIPDCLPEGVTLLSGRPKTGKSFLAEQWSLEIGQSARVLHLSLEYSLPMLQQRVRQFQIPDADVIWLSSTDIEPVGRGGLVTLDALVSRFHPVLVVVDVLTRFLGNVKGYEATYDAIGTLKTFAANLKVSMLILHHNRKSNKELDGDHVDDVLGSTAYASAPDTLLSISPHQFGYRTLRGEGRQIESFQHELQWRQPAGFEIASSPLDDDLVNASEQALVLQHIQRKGPCTNRDISEDLDKKVNTISNLTSKLLKKRKIHKSLNGQFSAPDTRESREFDE